MARLQTLVMTAAAAAILTPAAMAQAAEYPMAKTYSTVEEAIAAASAPNYGTTTYQSTTTYQTQTADQGTPISNIEIFDTPVQSTGTQVVPAATTYTYESPTTTYTSTYGTPSYETAQPAASAQYTYSVVRGDTLYSIATRNGLKVSELMNANGLSTSAINPGQALLIPSSTQSSSTFVQAVPMTDQNVISASQIVRNVEPLPASGQNYRVLPGDTLYSISRQYCTNVNAITTSSGIDRNSVLSPGQYLTVPQGVCAQ